MKAVPVSFRRLLLWIAAGVAFLLPALVNGQPFLFPDSVGYFRSGKATLEVILPATRETDPSGEKRPPKIDTKGDGVSTQRSPYYGVAVAIAERLGGQWLTALAQIALTLLAIGLAARRLGVDGTAERAGIAAVLGLVTGVGVFASTIMPDIFAAVMLLGIAMLLVAWRSMTAIERVFWIALVLFGCLAHKGHVAIAFAGLVASAALLLILRRIEWRPVVMIGAAVLLGGIGHVAVDMTVQRVTGARPVEAPFLLARMIGDGTVPRYLDAHCDELKLTLCRYRHRMPMTENEFLWHPTPGIGLMRTLPPEERAAISDEAGQIVIGTLIDYPLEQAAATLGNIGRQLLVAGVTQFGVTSGLESSRAPAMAATLDGYRGSAAFNDVMPLGHLSMMCVLAYLGAAAALLVLAIRNPDMLLDRSDAATIRLLVILGVLVNGVVCGAISGVFDRYQGRVAWLLPFILLAWLVARRREVQITTTAAAAP